MKSPNLDYRIWMPNRTFKYLFVYKRAHFLSHEINQLHDLSLFKNMMKKQPCSEINAFKNSDPVCSSIGEVQYGGPYAEGGRHRVLECILFVYNNNKFMCTCGPLVFFMWR